MYCGGSGVLFVGCYGVVFEKFVFELIVFDFFWLDDFGVEV